MVRSSRAGAESILGLVQRGSLNSGPLAYNIKALKLMKGETHSIYYEHLC